MKKRQKILKRSKEHAIQTSSLPVLLNFWPQSLDHRLNLKTHTITNKKQQSPKHWLCKQQIRKYNDCCIKFVLYWFEFSVRIDIFGKFTSPRQACMFLDHTKEASASESKPLKPSTHYLNLSRNNLRSSNYGNRNVSGGI